MAALLGPTVADAGRRYQYPKPVFDDNSILGNQGMSFQVTKISRYLARVCAKFFATIDIGAGKNWEPDSPPRQDITNGSVRGVLDDLRDRDGCLATRIRTKFTRRGRRILLRRRC